MINLIAPDVGSIVGCWFPYDDNDPPSPGTEFRPCLVLQIIKRIDKSNIHLLLSYGTGQSSAANKAIAPPWTIEIQPGDNNTLEETTRFNLKKLAVLPLENKFFKNLKSTQATSFSRFGHLSQTNQDLVVEKISKASISMDYSPHPKVCIVEKKKHLK